MLGKHLGKEWKLINFAQQSLYNIPFLSLFFFLSSPDGHPFFEWQKMDKKTTGGSRDVIQHLAYVSAMERPRYPRTPLALIQRYAFKKVVKVFYSRAFFCFFLFFICWLKGSGVWGTHGHVGDG
ncbi:hypothetical protein KKA95_03745 [Patescibacteria group bacterium]|nr:hypothetical protein [Patescibacteria group bacterium]